MDTDLGKKNLLHILKKKNKNKKNNKKKKKGRILPKLKIESKLNICAQITSALDYLHTFDPPILHRGKKNI